jgi:putative oxidoreductase
MDIALLIARLFLGLGLASHGAQKLFGWFGGGGLNKTGEFFVKLGWNQGRSFATAAGLDELGSGLLVAVGILGPVGPALMAVVLLTATLTVHVRNGFFATKNGVELPMVYVMGALLLAFTGPGVYSFDHILGLEWLSTPNNAWIAFGVAAVIALINYVVRRPPPPATA